MEIRDFAEQVLFSHVLEEKLAIPGESLTDTQPGAAIAVPDCPGRPDDLRFDARPGRTPLPSVSEVSSSEDRGVLLHFFANHELLAAELMALVLLRFPEAPAAFRMGVAETLREEQAHTLLYKRRLEKCGLHLGSQPVNDFFWRVVSGMRTPLDYVARLSLTFEQANLDFSRHFAAVFRRAGDSASARILDKIYHDEISHVGYGLRWFRKWKPARQSDWHCYRELLKLPLSPSRAKGLGPFNREGRRLAGLDEEFIEELDVYARSKGRTPDVHWFNPQAEACIAAAGRGDPVGVPDEVTLQLAEDLSCLSIFLAKRDDVALVRRRPGRAFLQQWRRAGWPLAEIQEVAAPGLAGRKLGRLRPWAWSPDSHAILQPYLAQVPSGAGWDPAWRELHSKAFAAALFPGHGAVATTVNETVAALATLGGKSVLKAPFGVAGRGLRWCSEGELRARDRAWLEHTLAAEGAVVVEPWLDRIFDFSVQYEASEDGALRLLGMVRLHNDARGRFQGCTLRRTLTDELLVPGLDAFFYGRDGALRRVYEQTVPEHLQPQLARVGFHGPLGIDAMIYRTADGALAHRPVVELNPRTTMGRVAWELGRQVVKGEKMRFQILTGRHLRRSGCRTWPELVAQCQERVPLVLETYQNGHTRLRAGCLPLNDPNHVRQFLAVLHVGTQAEFLPT